MIYISTISISFFGFFLLFFLGYGVTKYLLPREHHPYALFLTPIIGYSVAACILYDLNWLGLSGTTANWLLLLFVSAINIWVYKNKRECPIFLIKDNWAIIAIFIISFLIYYSTLISYGYLFPVYPNGDAVVYSYAARFALEGPTLPAEISSYPLSVWQRIASGGFRPGFPFFHSLVNGLLSLEPHESYAALNGIFPSLLVFEIYFLSNVILRLSRKESFLWGAFLAVQPNLYWMFSNYWTPNLIALSLLVASFSCVIIALNNRTIKTMILSALLCISIVLTYPEYMPNFVFMLISFVVMNKIRFIVEDLFYIIKIGIISVFLCPVFFLKMMPFYYYQFYLNGENLMPRISIYGYPHFISLSEICGFSHYYMPSSASASLSPFLFCIIIVLTIIGFKNSRADQKKTLFAYIVPNIALAMLFRYCKGYGYAYSKTLLTIVPIYCFFFIKGFSHLWGLSYSILNKKIIRIISSACMALIFAANIGSIIGLHKNILTQIFSPLSINDIASLKYDIFPKKNSLYIMENNVAKMLWLIYFLENHPVSFNNYNVHFPSKEYPFYKNYFSEDFIIKAKDIRNNFLHNLNLASKIYENKEYEILKKNKEVIYYQDTYWSMEALPPSGQLNIEISRSEIRINGRKKAEYDGDGPMEALVGLYIPIHAKLEVIHGTIKEELLHNNSGIKRIAINEFPSNLRLKNTGRKDIPLRFILLREKKDISDTKASNFPQILSDIYDETATPDSNAFVISGWHPLEKDNRWSKGESLAILKNPFSESRLIIKGTIPYDWLKIKSVVEIYFNSHLIDSFQAMSSLISKNYLISREIMGKEEWGEIRLKVNSTTIPNDINNSGDSRELAILLHTLKIIPLTEIKINIPVDIGEPHFDNYLHKGWSQNEISPDGTSFAWVEGNEATLNIYVEKIEEMQMKFRAMPFHFPGSSGQKATIFVNGTLIDEIDLKGSQWFDYNVHIPSSALIHGLNLVSFAFAYSNSPASTLPGSSDSRKLSAAFDYIEINSQWR